MIACYQIPLETAVSEWKLGQHYGFTVWLHPKDSRRKVKKWLQRFVIYCERQMPHEMKGARIEVIDKSKDRRWPTMGVKFLVTDSSEPIEFDRFIKVFESYWNRLFKRKS